MHEHQVVTTKIPGNAEPAFDALLMAHLAAVLSVKRPHAGPQWQRVIGVVNGDEQIYRLFMCFTERGASDVSACLANFQLEESDDHPDVDVVFRPRRANLAQGDGGHD